MNGDYIIAAVAVDIFDAETYEPSNKIWWIKMCLQMDLQIIIMRMAGIAFKIDEQM